MECAWHTVRRVPCRALVSSWAPVRLKGKPTALGRRSQSVLDRRKPEDLGGVIPRHPLLRRASPKAPPRRRIVTLSSLVLRGPGGRKFEFASSKKYQGGFLACPRTTPQGPGGRPTCRPRCPALPISWAPPIRFMARFSQRKTLLER